MTGTALALRKVIITTLEENEASLVPYLPHGVTPQRVIGLVKMAVDDNPKLLECDPKTVLRAVAKICSWGADIGSEAYLVPYGRACTPVADYKWKCDLVVQAGGARGIKRNVVREGDVFEWEDGTKLHCRHVPASLAGKKAGRITGSYAIALVGHGEAIGVYWPVEKLEAHRQQYSKQWKTGEMKEWWAIKTAIHDLVKTLPKSAHTAAMFAKLEKIGDEELAAIVEADADLDPNKEVKPASAVADIVSNDGEVQEETADFEVEEPSMTIQEACALILPGRPNESKVWAGNGGKRLDLLRNSMLSRVKTWCDGQLGKENGLSNAQQLIDGCLMILAARSAGTLKEPEKPAPKEEPKREPVAAGVSGDEDLPF